MENIFKETVVLVVRVGEMSYGTGTGVRCTGYEEALLVLVRTVCVLLQEMSSK